MKTKLFALTLLFAGIGLSAEAQNITNNSSCNHVVTVHWTTGGCVITASTNYAVGPGAIVPMTGGPAGATVHSADVDNAGPTLATVVQGACGGPTMFIPTSGCVLDVQLYPAGDLDIN